MDKEKLLWEILVPASNNENNYTHKHHKKWDAKVVEIAGGVTILKPVSGTWRDPAARNVEDRLIPCRIYCTLAEINEIIDFTIEHYKQEAVMAYEIAQKVIIKYHE